MLIEANRATKIVIDGNEFLYFGGTNYLSLAHRKELFEAAQSAFERFGFSAGASRLTSGEYALLAELEASFAAFTGSEAALVLPAGFMSNIAAVDGINDLVDYWVVSNNAHGSIKSALAQTNKVLFVADLMQPPALPRGSRVGYFAEPIDPLLGSMFDVAQLHSMLSDRDFLVLDEAHSIGVLGEAGRGALEHSGLPLNDGRVLRTGTFSKAFGAQGGFVVASQNLIDRIKQHSFSYKVSTPVTPLSCAAVLASLRLLEEDQGTTIGALHANIRYSNEQLARLGFEQFASHPTPIYHLVGSAVLRDLREKLPSLGLYLPTVTSYFAGFCEIGLRWTIQAGHSRAELDQLFAALRGVN